jgi:hypothetical protein
MEIEIEKEVTFKCPEGKFACYLEEVINYPSDEAKDQDAKVRLVFVVDVPWMRDKIVKAGTNLTPGGRDLQLLLKSWLGPALNTFTTDGKLTLESLVAQHGEIVTKHGAMNKKFKFPFVKIEDLRPPGSFNLTQKVREKGNII